NIEVLIRPHPLSDIVFECDALCPQLPSLKRLKWWTYGKTFGGGGINSLFSVLSAAPQV
ncbi:hypothetical protein C8F04DRAFT_989536, partial [Mycena alexandri]